MMLTGRLNASRCVTRRRHARTRVRSSVTYAALNPKDALVRKGKFKVLSGRRFPKHCGVDFAGIVEAPYGDLRAGDAVFGALSEWRFARGTLAELVAPRAAEVARIPAGVAEADAAAVALVGLTALQALRDVARVGGGASVLINGASGGVGTVAVQIARILGARVTTVSSAATMALCRSLGADETLDYTRLDEALGDAGFDVVFDVFGNLRFAHARAALRRRGRIRLDGTHTAAARVRAGDALLAAAERLWYGQAEPRGPDAARRVARRWATARHHRFALRVGDYAAAFHKLEFEAHPR